MKKIISLMLSLMFTISLSGCYDSKEISQTAFVIAVGFDRNYYTFQIVKPSAFEGDDSEDSPLLTKTISSPNVYEAMDKLNSSVSETCDFSHIKIAVFSKDTVETGIEQQINAMLKSNKFHPNIKIAMCEGKVSDYMKDMKIPLNTNPAEYYENLFRHKLTQYSPDTRLKDLQKNYSSHIPGCALPVINNENGMAITSNYKLTGTANATSTQTYNMLKNADFKGNFTIANGVVVSFKKTMCKFKVNIDDTPMEITVKLKLDGNITWSETKTDASSLEKEAKTKIENDVKNFLYKCSNNYKADILEFYKIAKTHYTTLADWEDADWQNMFENASYKVTVDADIKREGLNIN